MSVSGPIVDLRKFFRLQLADNCMVPADIWHFTLQAKNGCFINDSDSLTTLTTRYDDYILRYADFLWTMTTTMTTDGQTDYFTPCACAQGNYETLHDKTKHNAVATNFELRPPVPTMTFELLLLQILAHVVIEI